MTVAASVPTQNRRVLLVLLLITLAPVVLSSLLYFFWKPDGGKSYGQLLETKPVPAFAMTTAAGKAASLADFKGKWLLVAVAPADCPADCANALHALRQLRLAQGAEMARVQRLWLVRDGQLPSVAAMALAEGAEVRIAKAPIPLPGELEQGLYLIDPLGNQVMRYGRDQDHGKVIKEIGRLLKNNEALG